MSSYFLLGITKSSVVPPNYPLITPAFFVYFNNSKFHISNFFFVTILSCTKSLYHIPRPILSSSKVIIDTLSYPSFIQTPCTFYVSGKSDFKFPVTNPLGSKSKSSKFQYNS